MSSFASFAAIAIGGWFAAWWVIGDISESGDDLLYVIRPPSPLVTFATPLGVVGLIALLAGSIHLFTQAKREDWSHRWRYVAGSVLAASLGFGFASRVLTAGVASGANIGAGLVILFVLPGLATLLVAAYVQGLALHRATMMRSHER